MVKSMFVGVCLRVCECVPLVGRVVGFVVMAMVRLMVGWLFVSHDCAVYSAPRI